MMKLKYYVYQLIKERMDKINTASDYKFETLLANEEYKTIVTKEIKEKLLEAERPQANLVEV